MDATIFGFLDMLIELFDRGIVVVGGLIALVGAIAAGFGLKDIIDHFKPENRENPGEKNRAVSGAVKFVVGALLATGGYKVIANNSFEEGVTSAAVSAPMEQQYVADLVSYEGIAQQNGLTLSRV